MSETIGRLLCAAGVRLRAAGVPDARREARLLLAHVLVVDPAALLIARDDATAEADARRFLALVERRAAREPHAFVVGEAGFWTLRLGVSPATLIPRPDSETLIEAAGEWFATRPPPARIADLGTGTGALLLAALGLFPDAYGVGVDRAPAAARLAAANAARNGLDSRSAFLAGDWATALNGRFGLILCNPPYIPTGDIAALEPEVAAHEPGLALDGGPDGLDAYRAVLDALPSLMLPDGLAVVELGAGQHQPVAALAAARGLRPLPPHPDLGGVLRALPLQCAAK
jgi:release factor glutamine methyltransferase